MAYYGPRVRPQTYGGISNLTDALAKLPDIYGKSKLTMSRLETEDVRRDVLQSEDDRRGQEDLRDALGEGFLPPGYSFEDELPAGQPGVVDDEGSLEDYLTPGNVDMPDQAPPSAEAALAKGAATNYYRNIIGPDGKIAGSFDTRQTPAGREEARIGQRDERRAYEREKLGESRRYTEGRHDVTRGERGERETLEHDRRMELEGARYGNRAGAADERRGAWNPRQVLSEQRRISKGYIEYMVAQDPDRFRQMAIDDPDGLVLHVRSLIERDLNRSVSPEQVLEFGGPALERVIRENMDLFLEDDTDTGSNNLLDDMRKRYSEDRAVPLDTTGAMGGQDMQRRLNPRTNVIGTRP